MVFIASLYYVQHRTNEDSPLETVVGTTALAVTLKMTSQGGRVSVCFLANQLGYLAEAGTKATRGLTLPERAETLFPSSKVGESRMTTSLTQCSGEHMVKWIDRGR